jgi:hypothetical protein
LIDDAASAFGIHLFDLRCSPAAEVDEQLFDPLADRGLMVDDVRSGGFASFVQELLANDLSELAFCDSH